MNSISKKRKNEAKFYADYAKCATTQCDNYKIKTTFERNSS